MKLEVEGKPVAPFILGLIAGIFIFLGAIVMSMFAFGTASMMGSMGGAMSGMMSNMYAGMSMGIGTARPDLPVFPPRGGA